MTTSEFGRLETILTTMRIEQAERFAKLEAQLAKIDDHEQRLRAHSIDIAQIRQDAAEALAKQGRWTLSGASKAVGGIAAGVALTYTITHWG